MTTQEKIDWYLAGMRDAALIAEQTNKGKTANIAILKQAATVQLKGEIDGNH